MPPRPDCVQLDLNPRAPCRQAHTLPYPKLPCYSVVVLVLFALFCSFAFLDRLSEPLGLGYACTATPGSVAPQLAQSGLGQGLFDKNPHGLSQNGKKKKPQFHSCVQAPLCHQLGPSVSLL